jgi:hypothetical protein
MKLRSITILFAFAIASAAAHAQSGIYATFDAQEFTRTGLLANPPAGSSNSDSPWLYGPTFGVYYTPSHIHIPMLGTLHTGPILLGIDARGDILRTDSQYSRDDAIVSIRVTPKTPLMGIRPYIQGGAGEGHTKVPGASQTTYANNWSYLVAVGADHKIKGRIDWRVVEASAGFLANYKAGLNSNETNYMITVSSGLVVRLGGK